MDIAEFRQLAMIAALQGLMANIDFTRLKLNPAQIADCCIELADALLEENMADEPQDLKNGGKSSG